MVYNRIAILRVEQGVSRKALAEAVGVNPQTIGYLERGDYSPSLELGFKIARYFAAPVDVVFSLEPFEGLVIQLSKQGSGAGAPG